MEIIMKNYVRYEDFGAIGDGVNNDFFAMQAAHKYANENGLDVKGEPTATYLINNKEKDGVASSIEIKTNTDWCGATIIIDDTENTWLPGPGCRNHNTHPILIKSDYEPVSLPKEVVESIEARGGIHGGNIDRIGTGLGYPALLSIKNSEQRVYIRYGVNEDNGSDQFEVLLVDKDGYIDPSTPFMFDYNKATSIIAYRVDDKPITVENALIISRASKVNINPVYHHLDSGIEASRSNLTIKNLVHNIVGEIDKYAVVDKDSNVLPGYRYDWKTHVVYAPENREVTDGHANGFIGHSFSGFIIIVDCNNVLVENVTFQSRVYYLQGTYDLSCGRANNITFKNCDQANFFSNDRPDMPRYPSMGKCWGVGGSNFCKNMTYDGCQLTRYDAHSGLYNGKIINSEIAALRLTGAGNMLIENTKLYSYATCFISLREDYGSTWRGTITLKDCEVLDVCNDGRFASVITCASPNHYFGYPVYFPNIVIDNLKVENVSKRINLVCDNQYDPNNKFYYRSVYEPAIAKVGVKCRNGQPSVCVHNSPEFIKVINNEDNGYELVMHESEFFKNTKIEGIKVLPYES